MSRHWMPLYIADYLKDTSHLRALESGAYMHLIMAYWVNGGLPKNERQLATIAKMTDEEWYEHRETLQAFFSPDWTHKRIDKELAEADEKIAKKVEAGRAGGLAKASKRLADATANDLANGWQTATHSHSQSDIKKEGGADAHRSVKKDRKRSTRFPDGMTANRAAQEAAGLTAAEGDREFTKFRNHAHEKGRTCLDWQAAERNWYLKAAEFMGRKPPAATVPGTAIPTELVVQLYKQTGRWHRDYGPEPGQPGCRADPAILSRFGFGVAA
jgi:uncharacterized protein YdaU (DUF1376 family)